MLKTYTEKFIKRTGPFEDYRIRWLAVFLLFLVAAMFYQMTYYCALYIHDDIMNYCYALNGITRTYAVSVAESQGRIMFLPLTYLCHFTFLSNNLLIYKLISYASISFSAIALGVLVYRHFDKAAGFLAVLLFFCFAQVDEQHNLFSAYVLTHQIPIGILLLSFERQLEYYKTKKTHAMVTSAALLTISAMVYEAFILFPILTFAIAVAEYVKNKDKRIVRLMMDLKFHVIFMASYLLVYFLWRIKYPSAYEGNQVAIISIGATLRALYTYSVGLYPLRSFLQLQNVIHIRDYLTFPVLIKAVASALCFVLVLSRVKKISWKRLLTVSGLCVIGMIIPNILLSLTLRRVEWVLNSGTTEYVTSFYSYFFLIIILTALFLFLYSNCKFKKIILCIFAALIFAGSILTDASNIYNADIQEAQLHKMEGFSTAVQTDYFASIEENAVIYMPDYSGIHLNMENMNWFTAIYSDKHYVFTNNKSDLKFDVPTYMMRYDADTRTFWMGQIDANFCTDRIIVISETGFDKKGVILQQTLPAPVNVNGKSDFYETTATIPIDKKDQTQIEIDGTDLSLNTLAVVKGPVQDNKAIEYTYDQGFYGLEGWGADTASWSMNQSQILFYNRSGETREVNFTFTSATGTGEEATLKVNAGENTESFPVDGSRRSMTIHLRLSPGQNVVTFSCDASPLRPDGDPRSLVFYLLNAQMTL